VSWAEQCLLEGRALPTPAAVEAALVRQGDAYKEGKRLGGEGGLDALVDGLAEHFGDLPLRVDGEHLWG
jgi:hypothetical protein